MNPTAWVAQVLAFVAGMKGWAASLADWWVNTMGAGSKLTMPSVDIHEALVWAWQWVPMPVRYALLFLIVWGVVNIVLRMVEQGKVLIKWW